MKMGNLLLIIQLINIKVCSYMYRVNSNVTRVILLLIIRLINSNICRYM
jgi:hypothetical protein